MFRVIAPLLILAPSTALAAENGPVELAIGIGGMVILSIVVLIFANKANEGAEDPDNMDFADADTLYAKLINHLDLNGAYDVHVLRQSGNVERTLESLDVNEVTKQVSATMRRAKIDVISIRGDENRLELYRVMHNGRGRQEGKRIGGFDVQKVGDFDSSALPNRVDVGLPNSLQSNGASTELDYVFQEAQRFGVTTVIAFSADNEAKKAIVKAFFNVCEHFDTAPQVILDNFDPETGAGEVGAHYNAFIFMLIIADAYLSGSAELTQELRTEFSRSNAKWQKIIADNAEIDRVNGIMSFGDTSPAEVQKEFSLLWSMCEDFIEKDDHVGDGSFEQVREIYKDLMKEKRPATLDTEL